MLRSTKELEHYAIGATDGDIGHVNDFYFDDDAWVVRYLVVDTGTWLAGRTVLISPISIRQPDWIKRTLPVGKSAPVWTNGVQVSIRNRPRPFARLPGSPPSPAPGGSR